jgi:hypothetical protein
LHKGVEAKRRIFGRAIRQSQRAGDRYADRSNGDHPWSHIGRAIPAMSPQQACRSLIHGRVKRGSRSPGAASATLDARLRGHDGEVGGVKR